VPLHVTADRTDHFQAALRTRDIGRVTINEITAAPHRVERTPELISPHDNRHYKLSLQLDGTGFVAQDGRNAVLRPGDIAIYDTSRPYTIDFMDDVRCLVMAFPQDAFEVAPQLICRITAVRLAGDDGVGAVISPFMQHLAEHLEMLDGVSGERIVRSSLDLLTALVYAQIADGDAAAGESRWAEMQACKHWIDDHLDDPELSAAAVARAQFMSVRYLQYLFHDEGLTVSGYIRTRRLEGCRLDLSDRALTTLSVSQIAERWGFTDASHFSKVFKAEFGVPPREFRALQRPI
jgi:AraC-like DNA-binding protein